VMERKGRVLADRYHSRLLRTPREVRNALVYVLNNAKKHFEMRREIDPFSSAPWFGGWREAVGRSADPPPVVAARTWLLEVGWLRHGRIGIAEVARE